MNKERESTEKFLTERKTARSRKICGHCGGLGHEPVTGRINTAGCYIFTCVCGAEVISANPTGNCWDCKREFAVGPVEGK